MQTLSTIDTEKAFAVLEANGETIPTVMRARVEMGAEMPFAATQLEIYDTGREAPELIIAMLEAAFAVGGLACIEHGGAALELFARRRWALSPGISGLIAHDDGKTTFGRSWERAVRLTARDLCGMNARITVLRPRVDGEPRELYTPREVVADADEPDRIHLAKLLVAEGGLAALDNIERRFNITDMAAGAEIDRIALARELELSRAFAA
jgi:hypothetical protein